MTENISEDPIILFHKWLDLARESEINDPEAMALATCGADGWPSVRMVLLKDATSEGFKFHSNIESEKGISIIENPRAELCFHWKTLRKQVRVRGPIEIIRGVEADIYFAGRPYPRQIGAWASQQSRPLSSRAELESKIKELETVYPEGTNIPRPPYWVGFRVVPNRIEFWWDNPDRLHDRLVYEKSNNTNWTIKRVYP